MKKNPINFSFEEVVVFLGAGALQRHAINSARRLGFYTVGFDRDPKASSRELLHEFCNISPLDEQGVIKWLLGRKNFVIKAFWGNNDLFVLVRRNLELRFSLETPGLDLREIKWATDKLVSKRKFKSDLFPSTENVLNIDNDSLYVLKPRSGSGSRGLKRVTGLQLSESGCPDGFIVEPYMSGIEYGLNCFVTTEEIFWLDSVRRYFNHDDHFTPLGTVVSRAVSQSRDVRRSQIKLEYFIRDHQLLGPLKFDILVGPTGRVSLIEFSPRFHGEIDTSFVFRAAGIDTTADFLLRFVKNSCQVLEKPQSYEGSKSFGYISLATAISKDCYLAIARELSDQQNLEFQIVDQLRHRNSARKSLASTADISQYLFFESDKIYDDFQFQDISQRFNLDELR